MVGWQSHAADFMCEAQPPEMLHGPSLRGVGLRVEGGAGFGVYQQTRNVASPQLVGQHQSKGAAPCNEHVDGQGVCHGCVAFSEVGLFFIDRAPAESASQRSGTGLASPCAGLWLRLRLA